MAWERWSGGRVWIAKDGTRTYYGPVNGRMVSTRRHTEDEAVTELLRLNLGASTGPLPPLNDQWIEEYLADLAARDVSRQSIREKRRHLREWRTRIGPQRMTLQVLNRISRKLAGARNKVSSLKAYFTWLRQQGRVRRQDDVTLDLVKPPAPPPSYDRTVPIEHHRAAVAELEPRWADLLTVLLGTGLHVSELLRFCREGTVDGDVLVIPRHKSGEPHRVRVSARVRAAAERSREAGPFSLSLLYREVAEACDRAKVPRFGIGGYRHTVATNAVRSGATPEAVAHFLGHKSSYMVKQIYARAAVPAKVPTLE